MSDMLDDLDPQDAYQAYVERRRARVAEQPDLEVRPTLTEQDANVILDLCYGSRGRYNEEAVLKINAVIAKVERALARAREEGEVVQQRITRA